MTEGRRATARRVALGARGAGLVALATVCFAGVLTWWACVTPDFRAPDEPQQVSTVLRLAYEHQYPDPGTARIFPAVKGSYRDVGFAGIGLNSVRSTGALGPPQRGELTGSTMRELAVGVRVDSPYDYDQMTQHPPGYFAVLALVARGFNLLDRTPHVAILILRLCSAALLLPLPWLTFRLARSLGLPSPASAAASYLPMGLPQLTHIGGAVNNDTLAITLAALVTWLAVEVATRRRLGSRGVMLGLAAGALLLTKAFGLPLLLLVIVAIGYRWSRRGSRQALFAVASVGPPLLVGLAWWVRNLLRFGTLQPDGYLPSYLALLPHGHMSITQWLPPFLSTMARSFFADFGWLEDPLPLWAAVVASFVVVAAVASGIVRASRPGLMAMAQLSWIVLLIAIGYSSYQASNRVGALQGSQGRYLFGGVAAICVAVTAGVAARRRHRWTEAMLPVVALGAATLGLLGGITHFYAGTDLWAKLGAFSAWSPLRFRILVPFAAVTAGAVLVGAWRISRSPTGLDGASWQFAEPRMNAVPRDPMP